MKIMGPGMGVYLCIGTGLGLGLFAGPGWGWQALVGAIIIAVAGVLLKSFHYQSYVTNSKQTGTKPKVTVYVVFGFLQNSIIIFVVAFIVFFIKGLLGY